MKKYILIVVLILFLIFGMMVLADPSDGINPLGSVQPTDQYSQNIGVTVQVEYLYSVPIQFPISLG